jgi:hypothetical protein
MEALQTLVGGGGEKLLFGQISLLFLGGREDLLTQDPHRCLLPTKSSLAVYQSMPPSLQPTKEARFYLKIRGPLFTPQRAP